MTLDGPPQHHLTIPAHAEIKAGTLSAILSIAGQHLQLDKEQLVSKLKL